MASAHLPCLVKRYMAQHYPGVEVGTKVSVRLECWQAHEMDGRGLVAEVTDRERGDPRAPLPWASIKETAHGALINVVPLGLLAFTPDWPLCVLIPTLLLVLWRYGVDADPGRFGTGLSLVLSALVQQVVFLAMPWPLTLLPVVLLIGVSIACAVLSSSTQQAALNALYFCTPLAYRPYALVGLALLMTAAACYRAMNIVGVTLEPVVRVTGRIVDELHGGPLRLV